MLAGFFFLPRPQKWSLLVTIMKKGTIKIVTRATLSQRLLSRAGSEMYAAKRMTV
jgi:hypothetical protein